MNSTFCSILVSTLLSFCGFQSAADDPTGDSKDSVDVGQAVVTLIDSVRIPAEEPGVIESFDAEVGDLVEANAVLAKLNSDMNRLQLTIAEDELKAATIAAENSVDVEYAMKSAEVAGKVLERSRAANQRTGRAVSKTELERLQLEFERAKLSGDRARMEKEIAIAQRKIKKSHVDAAIERLEQRQVATPIKGILVDRLAQAGEWVDAGQPVARVIRLDKLRVQFFLDANTYDDSLIGKTVKIHVKMPPNGEERIFHGDITFVSPEVIPNRDQIAIWAEIENPDMSLRPGTTGRLVIEMK